MTGWTQIETANIRKKLSNFLYYQIYFTEFDWRSEIIILKIEIQAIGIRKNRQMPQPPSLFYRIWLAQ